ncbi:MAG TPA: dephospho-CoA kinase [Myxococcota bacterium]|jgi:dephospho-CoA kinase
MLAAMTRIVGLTGGIGTGKSTVARMLEALGAVVVDADAIVHELQAPGQPMLAEIAAAFGPELLRADGSLDRARLAQRVFADPAARQKLGEITHPAVGREMLRRLEAARSGGAALIVLDNPLLFEGRARRAGPGRAAARGSSAEPAQETILVYTPAETQVARQMARDGVTREFALQRMAAQLPIEEKRALATHVIDNAGSLEATERQVRALHAQLAR